MKKLQDIKKKYSEYKERVVRKAVDISFQHIPDAFALDPTYALRLMEKVSPFTQDRADLNAELLEIGQKLIPVMNEVDPFEAVNLIEFFLEISKEDSQTAQSFIEMGIPLIMPLAEKEPYESLRFLSILLGSNAKTIDQEKQLFDVGIKTIDLFALQNPWEVKTSIQTLVAARSCQTFNDHKGRIISTALGVLPLIVEKTPTEADGLAKTIFSSFEFSHKELAEEPLYGRVLSPDNKEHIVVISQPNGYYKNICFAMSQGDTAERNAIFHKAFFKGSASEFLQVAPMLCKDEDMSGFVKFAVTICNRQFKQLPKLSEVLCLRMLETKSVLKM